MPVRIVNMPAVLLKLAKGKPTKAIDAELAAKWAVNRIGDRKHHFPSRSAPCNPRLSGKCRHAAVHMAHMGRRAGRKR